MAHAQTGVLEGHVQTSDHHPVASATVQLEGTNAYTATDDNGHYRLTAAAGDYTLVVTLVGTKSERRQVSIRGNETTHVQTITLTESFSQLQEVVVSGSQVNKFASEQSDEVAKMPLTRLENPQVYSTIDRKLLTEQLIFSVDEAVKNAPGLQKMWEATGRSGDGGGYYNSRGFILQSQLRNGVAGNISAIADAANIDKIEVIKGPSATLFGSTLTSYGGLINRVTKKPYEKFGGEIAYATGNYGFNRFSADINTPLDSAKKLLLRVNTAYNDKGSFQDNAYNKYFVFDPSLSYRISDRLSFSLDVELYRGRSIGTTIFFFPYGQTIASMGVSRADQLDIDYKRSFTTSDLSQVSRNSNYFGQMTYRLSDHWQSQTNFTVTNSYSDGPYPYFYLLANSAVTGNPADIGSDYISRNDQFTSNSKDRMIEVQQNFNGEFNIGSLRNRFVGGLDFFNHNSDQFFSGGTLDTIASHGYIPTYRDFNKTNLEALYETKGVAFVYPLDFISNTYSAYASDVLNLTDKLMVLAALRLDHFVNKGNYDVTTGLTSGGYHQTALSPKFGLVFQPVKDKVSLFANYQNGFTNEAGTDAEGNTFKPEQANQLEGGLKLDLFGGRLSSTLSYYDIKVKDIIRADAANPNFSIQNGTQLSKGFEAEMIANPFQGMDIVAGFSYNDSKLEKADADVEGLRPATASSPYLANLWLSYHLPKGKLKGLGLGFGGNYASDNKVVNSKSQGVFILPAYTVMNASVFYDQPRYRLSARMDNLGNRKYWTGYSTMNPQELRSFVASIAFKF